jgi:hypothetical protein
MSSVVLSSQRVPAAAKKASGPHPLVQDQTELVPNITHVFTQDQHLYLQYEVYDAARGKNPAAAIAANGAANSSAANNAANGATNSVANVAANNGATNNGANVTSSAAPKAAAVKAPKDSVRVFTSIEFLQGSTKVYESKPILANEVTAPDRKAVIFQIDFPLQSLKPGFYVCQVNVVDDVSGNFAFPRSPILVKEAAQLTPTKVPAGK